MRLFDRRGVAAIEFALVGGIFFLTMLAVMELSRYYLTMHSARNVVAQAARAAMIYPTVGGVGTPACNTRTLLDAAGGLGFVANAGQLCVTRRPQPGSITEIEVTLTAPYNFIVPVFGFTNLTITERQTFRFGS